MAEAYDVVVAGGGPGGCAAAVVAARLGAKVLLIEREGCLGGMATTGLVHPFMGYHAGEVQLSAGVFAELVRRLTEKGGMLGRHIFDDETMKVVLDEMLSEAGVTVVLGAMVSDATVAGRRVLSATVVSKAGTETVRAAYFVDATGDGDLAARAGARVEVGRPDDGLCQPMTLCFRMAGVGVNLHDDAAFAALREELNRVYLRAKEVGRVSNPRHDVLVFRTVRPEVLHFNTTRVIGRSALDAADLSAAEVEGRRQAWELAQLFRAEVPAMRQAYLSKTAARIGVRESRRIIGHYLITEQDILQARKFPDGIARANYPIDIHNPTGGGTVIKRVPPGDWYDIPYRSLVPEGLDNLIVGSRCISATHEAHSAIRTMPTVATIGQAAGTACALALQKQIPLAELDIQTLRRQLLADGASLTE